MDLEAYLAPGALDGYLGVGIDTEHDDEDTQDKYDEQMGRFRIPDELLIKMPIVEVDQDTRIIHINKPTPTPIDTSNVPTPGQPQVGNRNVAINPPPTQPKPGPSGVYVENEPNPTDHVLPIGPIHDPTANHSKETPNTSGNKQADGPKKGYNIKNRKRNATDATNENPPDDSIRRRMDILTEIASIVQKSDGRNSMTELDLWGQYMGLKVARIENVADRDDAVLKMERIVNNAIHGRHNSEE